MYPYDQLYPDPFQAALKRQQEQRALQPEPVGTPAQDAGTLGQIVEGSLGGLSYLGKILDKTFGGRALRGVLGDKPNELLSVLPFSDTIGLTNEADTVQGTDLLAKHGLITPGDDSLESQIAGFGAEVALDPATWVGAAVPKLVGRTLGATGSTIGKGLEAVAGVNPYTYGARHLDNAYQAVRAPIRGLFDNSVAGAMRRDVQPLGEAYTARLKQLQAEAEATTVGARNAAADIFARSPGASQEDVYRALLQNSEGFGHDARATLGTSGLNPADVDPLLDVGSTFADRVRATSAPERAVGVVSKEAQDVPQWVSRENEAARAAGLAEPYPGDLPFPGYQPAGYAPRTLADYGEGDVLRGRSSRLSGTSEFQTNREDDLRGIAGGADTFNQWARNPALSGSAATMPEDAAAAWIAQQLTGLPTVPANHPALGRAAQLAERLRQLPPAALQKGFYSTDVFGSGHARLMESARTVASGETIKEGIRRFARPVQDLEAEGVKGVRVPEILDSFGLTHRDFTGTPVAAEDVLRSLGLSHGSVADLAQLKNLALPADVVQDMARIGAASKTPAALQPVIDVWDRTVGLFKTYLTKLFPAFHSRNLMSGVFNMWRDGALDPAAGRQMFSVMRGGALAPETAARLYPGASLQDATRAFRDEVMSSRLAFTRNTYTADAGVSQASKSSPLLSEIPQVGGTPAGVGEGVADWLKGFVPEKGKAAEQLNPLRVGAAGEPATYIRQADKLGNAVEDWIRGTHYLAKREAGFAPEAARAAVLKYQIDYQEMTQFEKNVMKRVFPWYSFSRRSLPPLLQDLATNPAKVAGTTRALTGVRDPGDFTPPWIAEGASLPIPGAPDGQQRYVSAFGLPMEDEAVKTLGSAAHGDYQRVFQQLFGMAQPLIKLPAELATDTQMFSGRKLEDLKPYTLFDGLPQDTARQLTEVLANSPVSRFGSTLNKAIDERKGTGATALNLLFGAQVSDVDTEKVKDVVARDVLKDLLRGKPAVRTSEDLYVPAADRGRLAPEDLLTYDMLKEIEKRSQARARDKAKKAKAQPSY